MSIQPEIAEYPDNGNTGVFSRAPGSAGEADLERFLDGSAQRGYFDAG